MIEKDDLMINNRVVWEREGFQPRFATIKELCETHATIEYEDDGEWDMAPYEELQPLIVGDNDYYHRQQQKDRLEKLLIEE